MNPVSLSSNVVRLIDSADEPGRTTATILASLAARLAVLHLISGADALGSLIAGFGALGRDIGQTAKGARLRQAIEAGRAGTNGAIVWDELKIGDWVSSMPPSPVLDQLHNDLALILVDDLETALKLIPVPNPMVGERGVQDIKPVEFMDYLLGLWAFSAEFVRAVEMLAAPTLAASKEVTFPAHFQDEPENELLR